jgi:putative transposase
MLRSAFSLLLLVFKSHTQLHLEVLFLRKQLETVARSSPILRLTPSDRFSISFLTVLYDCWREALLIVQPETVIRWHRQGRINPRWSIRIQSTMVN